MVALRAQGRRLCARACGYLHRRPQRPPRSGLAGPLLLVAPPRENRLPFGTSKKQSAVGQEKNGIEADFQQQVLWGIAESF